MSAEENGSVPALTPSERERRAWICGHKDCAPPRRVFLLPGDPEPPLCKDHGRTMIRQTNVPYPRREA